MLVGHTYYIANPIAEHMEPQSLRNFVESNAQRLGSQSAFQQCADAAARRLLAGAFRSFDPKAADDAYERSLSAGATGEQAESVRASINQGSIDLLTIGQELAWLAATIPPASVGNWDGFVNTGTQSRLQIRHVWPIYDDILDSSSKHTLAALMTQYQPWLEYQVAYLVFVVTR